MMPKPTGWNKNTPEPTASIMSPDARAAAAAAITGALIMRWKQHMHPPAAVEIFLDVLARLDAAALCDEGAVGLIDYGDHAPMRPVSR